MSRAAVLLGWAADGRRAAFAGKLPREAAVPCHRALNCAATAAARDYTAHAAGTASVTGALIEVIILTQLLLLRWRLLMLLLLLTRWWRFDAYMLGSAFTGHLPRKALPSARRLPSTANITTKRD
jgi:hypothetical protein